VLPRGGGYPAFLRCQIAGMCVDDFRGRRPACVRAVLPAFSMGRPLQLSYAHTHRVNHVTNEDGFRVWQNARDEKGGGLGSLVAVRLSALLPDEERGEELCFPIHTQTRAHTHTYARKRR
jgi:hypothetical protein